MEKYKLGDIVTGEITGITKYGVFVKIDKEYTGLIHISEISEKYVSNLEKLYVLEETVEGKIIEINEDKKQLKLSTKEINTRAYRRKKPIQESGTGFEALKNKLNEWTKEKLEELKKISKTP